MAEIKLAAQVRNEFGKGPARRARAAELVPAVLYGHKTDPIHLYLPAHETFLIIKDTSNAVVTLDIEGETQFALIKDIQRHAVRRYIQHIDLLVVKAGEKIEVDVPIVVEGESFPGTIHTVEEFTLLVLASAMSIPEEIKVNIEGMERDSVVRISDIKFPEGVECDLDPGQVVISISVPQEEVAAPVVDAEADADEEADSE